MSNVSDNTVGFWKDGNRLFSSFMKKSRIPKGCRLMLVKNRYKKSGDNKPDYIGYFISVADKDAKEISAPYAVLSSQLQDEE